jgi:hypothetical protein
MRTGTAKGIAEEGERPLGRYALSSAEVASAADAIEDSDNSSDSSSSSSSSSLAVGEEPHFDDDGRGDRIDAAGGASSSEDSDSDDEVAGEAGFWREERRDVEEMVAGMRRPLRAAGRNGAYRVMLGRVHCSLVTSAVPPCVYVERAARRL